MELIVRARQADLVSKEVGDELVVFDTRTDEAHLLNASLTVVWRACRDGAPVDDIRSALGRALGTDEGLDDLVTSALSDLERAGLLEPSPGLAPFPVGISRRSLLKKAGIAALAIPAITTILAPPVAAQQSPPPCPLCPPSTGQPCCLPLTCQTTTTGLKCCDTQLGSACGGSNVCCEGACTGTVCCNQFNGDCTFGNDEQCCGSLVCHTNGKCKPA